MSNEATTPAPPVIAPALLLQFSGQTAVKDPAIAEQQLIAARAAQKAARNELKRVSLVVLCYRARLWAARSGIPAWLAWLIPGSVAAIVLAAVLTFLFAAGLTAVFAGVVLAYVACGSGAFCLFCASKGENAGNRVQIRVTQLERAVGRHRCAVEAVRDKTAVADRAQELGRQLQEALQSEANKHQIETSRLLSIEPGRLYPDEFERHVADIFRHLGFTVEITGESGDQGVDVLACKGTLRVAIQAKRYIGAVGNAAVQQVYAGMAHYKCHRCLVVTTSEFTSGATALAQSTGCLLIGAETISALIRGEVVL